MIDMSMSHPTSAQGMVNERAQHLLDSVGQYMSVAEAEQVAHAFSLAWSACGALQGEKGLTLIEHALAIATILAEMHIDAVGVASGLIFEAVDADLVSLEGVETALGAAAARVVGSMLRLNILERKKRAGAQFIAFDRAGGSNTAAADGENSREQKKQRIREALRRQQAETVRKMFFAMSEDPRVVLLKLAYRLHAMRLIAQNRYPVDQQEIVTMADRKSTRLNSSHYSRSRMPSSA